ncbi:MAG TPA: cytochrome ubiquinol oxidase subunit I, partial [Salinivirgaceae bacterium]|nr:cytochrome ubiquinol oxidase subunit I [Salinivirgaceae bacterium]
NDPSQIIPNVPISFYSFRIMVGLGFLFLFIFIYSLYLLFKNKITGQKWFLRLAIISIPLAYLATQAGWIVAEMGRQPWVIQDIMPTMVAVSHVDVTAVLITFWLFAVTFTILAIAEIKIMTKQIKLGPKTDGGN